MWRSIAMGLAFAGACAAGWRDSPRSARVRKDCVDQVSSTNDDRAWTEKYCDTVVKNSEAEWHRREAGAGRRDASIDPAETESVNNTAIPDAATNDAAKIADQERERAARQQKA